MKRFVSLILALAILAGIFVFDPMEVHAEDITSYAPVFNAVYYANHNQDVRNVYGTDENQLFQHFLQYGMSEGRQASDEFNVYAYMNRYEDLHAAFGDDLPAYYRHYIEYGKSEGRNARQENAACHISNGQVVASGNPLPEVPLDNTTLTGIAGYYGRSVFVGDSIMVGFRNYAANTPDSCVHNATFLATTSYSLYSALMPLEASNLHPTFRGQKYLVWDALSIINPDRVFIMFGTNDLVCYSPDKIVSNYVDFISRIKAANPNIEINVISMTPVYSGTNNGCLNKDGVACLNAGLIQMCQDNGYNYVNLYDSMVGTDGCIVPSYSSDRYVHMNNNCYATCWENTFRSFAYGQ